MSPGETAYLALAITAFLTYIGLLAYGVAVAAERPSDRVAAERKQRTPSGSGAAHAH